MDENSIDQIVKFKVVGVINDVNFQRGRHYALAFHKHLPDKFLQPEICNYMSLEWLDFLSKCKRKFGGKFFELDRRVAVFVNDVFLGDDSALIVFISKKYKFSLPNDYKIEATRHLQQYLKDQQRTHIYMNISVEDKMVGSLIFRLYTDLVPRVCAHFIRLVTRRCQGYNRAPIHRIEKAGWIQCGGFNLKKHRSRLPCENYCIPHDKRGVLSMCHNGKHTDNNTQFSISLNPTPFMNYKYVAFGQLVDGESTLATLENVPTFYGKPIENIEIRECGIYTFKIALSAQQQRQINTIMKHSQRKEVDLAGDVVRKFQPPPDILDQDDVDSEFNLRHYYKGLYCFHLDKGTLPKLQKHDELTREFLKKHKLGDNVLDCREVPSDLNLQNYQTGKYFFELDQKTPPLKKEYLKHDMISLIEEI